MKELLGFCQVYAGLSPFRSVYRQTCSVYKPDLLPTQQTKFVSIDPSVMTSAKNYFLSLSYSGASASKPDAFGFLHLHFPAMDI